MGSADGSVDAAGWAVSGESSDFVTWAFESCEGYGFGAALIADDSGYMTGDSVISVVG